jgi:hypothetical protein
LGHIFFGKNGIGGTFWNTDCAVNTFVGVDDQEVRALTEAVDGAYVYAIRKFALDTVFSHDVSHGFHQKGGYESDRAGTIFEPVNRMNT